MEPEEHHVMQSLATHGFFTNMPDELTMSILSFLGMRDLCKMAQVC